MLKIKQFRGRLNKRYKPPQWRFTCSCCGQNRIAHQRTARCCNRVYIRNIRLIIM